MLKELKDFILRGNVIDLAVAVIIGAAFTLVVNSFAQDILMQIVAAIFGKPNFDDLTFTIGDGVIYYGRFLTTLINFVIVAAAMFLVIKAVNHMTQLRKAKLEEAEEAAQTELELLAEIRDALVQGRGPTREV